jgi:hypothetical protein
VFLSMHLAVAGTEVGFRVQMTWEEYRAEQKESPVEWSTESEVTSRDAEPTETTVATTLATTSVVPTSVTKASVVQESEFVAPLQARRALVGDATKHWAVAEAAATGCGSDQEPTARSRRRWI